MGIHQGILPFNEKKRLLVTNAVRLDRVFVQFDEIV